MIVAVTQTSSFYREMGLIIIIIIIIRKMLTMYKMHHPKGDIDRLYVKRKEGGRGLVHIEAAYKVEIINIAE